MWSYDRTDRLDALVARSRAAESYLRRSMKDAPRGSADRHQLARRLDVIERRVRRLCDVARWARRARQEAFSIN